MKQQMIAGKLWDKNSRQNHTAKNKRLQLAENV